MLLGPASTGTIAMARSHMIPPFMKHRICECAPVPDTLEVHAPQWRTTPAILGRHDLGESAHQH